MKNWHGQAQLCNQSIFQYVRDIQMKAEATAGVEWVTIQGCFPLFSDRRSRDSSFILFHADFCLSLDNLGWFWQIFSLIPGIFKTVPNVSPFTCPHHPRRSHGRQNAWGHQSQWLGCGTQFRIDWLMGEIAAGLENWWWWWWWWSQNRGRMMYFQISKLLNSSTNNVHTASQLSGSASNGGKEETGTKSWPQRNTSLPCVRGYRKHECMSHVSMSARSPFLAAQLLLYAGTRRRWGTEGPGPNCWHVGLGVLFAFEWCFELLPFFLVFFCPNIVTVCIVTSADYHPKRYSNYFFVLDSPDCRVFQDSEIWCFNP